MKEKGDPIDDQYEPSGADESGPLLPGPLYSVLPETAVPVADLRELEEYEDIVHVLLLLSIETGFGAVCERFAIQFEETGYVLKNFPARMADRRGGRRRKQDRRRTSRRARKIPYSDIQFTVFGHIILRTLLISCVSNRHAHNQYHYTAVR